MSDAAEDRIVAQVIKIWSDILDTAVSRDDTFLELGGDSLSAMLCIARMQNAFGVQFDIEHFFMDDSTVSGFAANLRQFGSFGESI